MTTRKRETRKRAERKLRGKRLSKRELGVLLGMASGLTSRQIADKHMVSETTIKMQKVVVIKKLGAHNSCHAVALGFKRGLLVWPSAKEEQK